MRKLYISPVQVRGCIDEANQGDIDLKLMSNTVLFINNSEVLCMITGISCSFEECHHHGGKTPVNTKRIGEINRSVWEGNHNNDRSSFIYKKHSSNVNALYFRPLKNMTREEDGTGVICPG